MLIAIKAGGERAAYRRRNFKTHKVPDLRRKTTNHNHSTMAAVQLRPSITIGIDAGTSTYLLQLPKPSVDNIKKKADKKELIVFLCNNNAGEDIKVNSTLHEMATAAHNLLDLLDRNIIIGPLPVVAGQVAAAPPQAVGQLGAAPAPVMNIAAITAMLGAGFTALAAALAAPPPARRGACRARAPRRGGAATGARRPRWAKKLLRSQLIFASSRACVECANYKFDF
ncbi:uncharacterized protein LOC132205388 [Neocloeon triangulifer]|uniref:uncharacterized protein LOC132205388 n=1 Tax=Neocloeon triangulifer TaxID=2078957 RepID=UPI00286F2967|nr:uncharacterized protein LOC132205388 [Neocloeon triangulifer]